MSKPTNESINPFASKEFEKDGFRPRVTAGGGGGQAMSAEEPFEENGVTYAYRYEFVPEGKDKIAVHVYSRPEDKDEWTDRGFAVKELLAYGVRERSANR
ncbi:MAG: hypothetical protein LBD13_03910 [Spirochaetaceae bacterium]|jgi:hypothetical protein|nr:hypothetical protein [Spirochaetaceae bacterium]